MVWWPCNEADPEGTERLYAEADFWSDPQRCENYGRDLVTGAPVEPTEYKAMNPSGKAVIKAAGYQPPHEQTSADFPYALITGRTLYHFHTRTKTAHAPTPGRRTGGLGGMLLRRRHGSGLPGG
ncbi:hypothetical protein [Streptomyces sp. NPDC020607]|uniref:hypothetical protein n=1 Tax=Streptomyces sp. NPDC020607 TaxID=3365082 RepID=UPI0037A09AF0